MKIDIDHIAGLAKLCIDAEQKERFSRQMEAMLDLVGSLPAIEEDTQRLDAQNPMPLRPDVVQPSLRREETLQNAPSAQAGCFVVPRVIE